MKAGHRQGCFFGASSGTNGLEALTSSAHSYIDFLVFNKGFKTVEVSCILVSTGSVYKAEETD